MANDIDGGGLRGLVAEMQWQIVANLDGASRVSLAFTCRSFYEAFRDPYVFPYDFMRQCCELSYLELLKFGVQAGWPLDETGIEKFVESCSVLDPSIAAFLFRLYMDGYFGTTPGKGVSELDDKMLRMVGKAGDVEHVEEFLGLVKERAFVLFGNRGFLPQLQFLFLGASSSTMDTFLKVYRAIQSYLRNLEGLDERKKDLFFSKLDENVCTCVVESDNLAVLEYFLRRERDPIILPLSTVFFNIEKSHRGKDIVTFMFDAKLNQQYPLTFLRNDRGLWRNLLSGLVHSENFDAFDFIVRKLYERRSEIEFDWEEVIDSRLRLFFKDFPPFVFSSLEHRKPQQNTIDSGDLKWKYYENMLRLLRMVLRYESKRAFVVFFFETFGRESYDKLMPFEQQNLISWLLRFESIEIFEYLCEENYLDLTALAPGSRALLTLPTDSPKFSLSSPAFSLIINSTFFSNYYDANFSRTSQYVRLAMAKLEGIFGQNASMMLEQVDLGALHFGFTELIQSASYLRTKLLLEFGGDSMAKRLKEAVSDKDRIWSYFEELHLDDRTPLTDIAFVERFMFEKLEAHKYISRNSWLENRWDSIRPMFKALRRIYLDMADEFFCPLATFSLSGHRFITR